MTLRSRAVLLAVMTLACMGVAAQEDPNGYHAMLSLPSDGQFTSGAYRFDYLSPDPTMRKMRREWSRYEGNTDLRFIAMVIGVPGTSSYALSVSPPVRQPPKTGALAFLSLAYPDETFVQSVQNPKCALREAITPVALGPDMVSFNAACVDARTGRLVEVILSWKDDHLRFQIPMGDLAEQSRLCSQAADNSGKVCDSAFPQMRRSFLRTVETFRFVDEAP